MRLRSAHRPPRSFTPSPGTRRRRAVRCHRRGPARPLGSDRYVTYVDDIQRSGQRLLSLINDILDLWKIEAAASRCGWNGRRYRLWSRAASAWCSRSPIAGGVNLQFQPDGADLRADRDSRAVTRMVINLVSNAVKFSPAGGTVEIRLEPSTLGGAKISVAGPGIEEEVLHHLFEAYAHRAAMTTRRQDGVGLGLGDHQGADRTPQRADPRGDPGHHHEAGTASRRPVSADAPGVVIVEPSRIA